MKHKTPFLIILFTIMLFSTISVKASHYMGGEITWECLSNGKYIFYLKTYRECAGISFPNSQTINSNSPAGSFTVNLVSGYPKDISPVCNSSSSFTHLHCSTATTPNTGAISVYLYKSAEIQLNGIPPAMGWSFYWGYCCRNYSTNIYNGNAASWRINSIMYRYKNQATYPCFDNSPDFAAPPATVVTTGYNALSSFSAIDKDNDNLKYQWGQTFLSTGAPITNYAAGYSYSSPFPDTSQNSNNIAAELDTLTGIIEFTSYTTGSFVTSVKVSSFRDGYLLAEVNREIQVIIRNDTNNAPDLHINSMLNPVIIRDTLIVGDSVSYNILASDFQSLPNGSASTVKLDAYGTQFGAYIPASGSTPAHLSATTGCLKPPCARLSPAWNILPQSAAGYTSTIFKWKTSLNHLDSNSTSNYQAKTYNFYFRTTDDFCPVPAERSIVLSFFVTTGNIFESPDVKCIETKANGDVVLKYNTVADVGNSFDNYYIYSSTSKTGNFVLLDSIANPNIGEYTHVGAGADTISRYYIVKVKSTTSYLTNYELSDTISTLNLSVAKNNICTNYLVWNPPFTQMANSPNYTYRIYRKPIQGNWMLIDSTNYLHYLDTLPQVSNDYTYRVSIESSGLKDSTGTVSNCQSWSNPYLQSGANIVIESPIIRTANVLLNGDVKLHWRPFNDVTNSFYNYQIFTSSTQNGPFTLLTTINNKSQKYYLHTSVWPMSNSQYYYLNVTTIDCNGNHIVTPATDTIKTMQLNAYVTSTNKVKLQWNSMRNNKLPTTSTYYYIYENIVPGNWILIDSTSNQFYIKNVSENTTQYRISVMDRDNSQLPVNLEGFSNYSQTIYLKTKDVENIEFKVFQNTPNPFSKESTITFQNPKEQNLQFIIYDNNGKKISTRKIKAHKGINRFTFTRKGLSGGIYYYSLDNGNKVITKRFIVN